MLRKGGGTGRKDVEAVNYSSHPRDNDFPLFVERRKQPTLCEIPCQDAFSSAYTHIHLTSYLRVYIRIFVGIYIYICMYVHIGRRDQGPSGLS